MSLRYRPISWNRQKRIYDSVLGLLVLAYLAVFIGLGSWIHPYATLETLLIRGLGTAALLLLHVVLSIGPLCRLDRRFLPLLYNRRHLGVMTFLLGLAHGLFALIQFHGFGDLNPLVSLLVSNTRYDSLAQFPFQQLGALALIILFLMAATSHDFWLRNLTPALWKRLHMSVYVAYGLLVAHVVLGVLQSETNPLLVVLLAAGITAVIGLHLAAALRERRVDQASLATREGFIQVCPTESIRENRARVFSAGGERIAVFRYGNQVSALSNVCAHQNGPLGEGRIIDGCVTCPWHGYQYLPDSGASPPPFHEKVPTYRVKVIDGDVFVHPQPNPPGRPVEPVRIQSVRSLEDRDEFYIGYEPKAPPKLARRTILTVAGLCAFTLCISLLLVKGQRPFAPAVFEFQQYKGFEGLIEGRPVPTLLVRRPGATGDLPAVSRYPLVLPGKHGASLAVKDFDGTQVHLRGSLIYNAEQMMIELLPNSIRAFPHALQRLAGQTAADDLGVRTLVGEIADTKCYFGVMNPGNSKVHRDCAVRCIGGGIPPGLLVGSQDGMSTVLLLVGADGRQLNDEILEKVGEPVEIRGRVVRSGDTLRLNTEPQSIRRL